MRTLLKLLIVLAVLNALVRGADAAWNYYQMKDAAARVLLFGSAARSAQLHKEILEEAAKLDVPLRADDLTVRRLGERRLAAGTYVKPVEFFPNYIYPLRLSFTVDGATVGAPADDEDVVPGR